MKLTLVYAYYKSPQMLRKHLEEWVLYPSEVLAQTEFIITDDCSSELGIETVLNDVPAGLNIRIFKITKKVPWNWLACRNIGAKYARGEWIVLTDIDHMIQRKHIIKLYQAFKLLQKDFVYLFTRIDAPNMTEYKPHNDSFLMTRNLFWKTGGYDEDLSGNYGTSGRYRNRVFRLSNGHKRIKIPLTRFPREVVPDASTVDFVRKGVGRDKSALFKIEARKAQRGAQNKITTLSFPFIELTGSVNPTNTEPIVKEPTILQIMFACGVGNRIFQYIFGRLTAEKNEFKLSHGELPVLGVHKVEFLVAGGKKLSKEERTQEKKKRAEERIILKSSDHDALSLFMRKNPNANADYIEFKGHPEDFTLYTPDIETIRGWFPAPKVVNDKDLVLHLRATDKLLMSADKPISVEKYIEGIKSFTFNKLYIVTDMPEWKEYTVEELVELEFHRTVNPEEQRDPKESVEIWNSFVRGLSIFNPSVRAGYSVESDFEFMRIFKQVMLAHGTLAWWAAALGNAEKVGVYGKWRSGKDCNLAWTDLPGWFQWGDKTAPERDVKEYHLTQLALRSRCSLFVETGTRGGLTLAHLAHLFDKSYSVEIIPEAYEKARRTVAKLGVADKVEMYLGDSAQVIKEIMPKITKPTLFWLDAHDGRNSTPIMQELDVILRNFKHHVIVIDDSRYFGTEEAYPTIDQVRELVNELCPVAAVDVKFDAIRIFMKGSVL